MCNTNRFQISLLFSFILLFNPYPQPPLPAQTPVAADSLSLEMCIKLAIEHSPSIKNNLELYQAARLSNKIDKAELKPQLDMNYNFSGHKLANYTYNYLDGGVEFYFDLPKILGKYPRLSEIAIEKYTLLNKLEEQISIRTVKQIYYAISRLNLDLASIKEGLNYIEHHLTVVQTLYEAGQRSKLDLLNTRSDILKLNENKIYINKELDKLQYQLNIVTGYPPNRNTAIRHLELEELSNLPPMEQLLHNAFIHNPEILISQNENRSISARIEMEKKANYPLFLIGNRLAYDRDPTGDGNYYMIYSGLSFPVFDWGKRKLRQEELTVQKKAQEYETQNIEQNISLTITSLYSELLKQKELIALRKNNLEVANEASQYAEISYRSGLSSNTDVLNTHKTLIEINLGIKKALFDFMTNAADLEFILGVQLYEIKK